MSMFLSEFHYKLVNIHIFYRIAICIIVSHSYDRISVWHSRHTHYTSNTFELIMTPAYHTRYLCYYFDSVVSSPPAGHRI